MAKNKIQRIDQEIAKVREKIAEYQDSRPPERTKWIFPDDIKLERC